MVDEDWLNGRDDDLDGMIDEDFAAISNQMFSCWYNDYEPIIQQIFPQHNPLGINIRQESYQWGDDRFDDFVGIEYTITNVGDELLEEVFVGGRRLALEGEGPALVQGSLHALVERPVEEPRGRPDRIAAVEDHHVEALVRLLHERDSVVEP